MHHSIPHSAREQGFFQVVRLLDEGIIYSKRAGAKVDDKSTAHTGAAACGRSRISNELREAFHDPSGARGIEEEHRHPAEVRQLHRRRMGATGARAVLHRSDAGDRPAVVRGRPLDRRGHREGAGCGACGQGCLGQDLARRAVARSQQDRRPHGGAAERFGDGRDARQRQADPRDDGPPTYRSPSTTSATSPVASAPRKERSARSTTPPTPTISTSHWASSARSSRGTSRC